MNGTVVHGGKNAYPCRQLTISNVQNAAVWRLPENGSRMFRLADKLGYGIEESVKTRLHYSLNRR
ncbi:hypothetical protein ACQZ4R_05865 [Agrobacterium vitis]